MRRLRLTPLIAVALAVVGTMTAPTTTAATRPAAVAHPGAPSALRAYQVSTSVKITWTNPRTKFDHVVFRYTRGTKPPAAAHGTLQSIGKHATSATITKLTAGAAYAVSIWTRDRKGHFSARATTTFRAPRTVASTAGTLRGKVTDSAGHPLQGVVIDASAETLLADYSGVTDAAGAYSLTVPAGDYFVLANPSNAKGGDSDATGYYLDYSEVRVAAHRVSTQSFALDSAGAITGRVVDKAGKPIPDVAVSEQPVTPAASAGGFSEFGLDYGSGYAITAADGTYTLKGAIDYASTLCFAPQGYDPAKPNGYAARCTDNTIAVAVKDTRASGDTTLAAGTNGAAAVTVTTASGHAVPKALVFVYGPEFASGIEQTDQHGRVLETGLPAGDYLACAATSASTSPGGYQPVCKRMTVRTAKTTTVALVLKRGAAIAGTVVGPHGPLAGAFVTVADTNQNTGAGANLTTDATGRYSVSGLPAGNYVACAQPSRISASAPTGTRSACFNGGAHAQATIGSTRLLDVTVHSGAVLSGTVRTSTGRAASGAFVDASTGGDSDDDYDSFAQVGAQGRYTMGGLEAAKYRVCAFEDFFAGTELSACSTATTALEHGAHVNLTLPKAGDVLAVAQDEAGNALTGVDAVLLAPCGQQEDSALDGGCGPLPAFSDTSNVRVVASADTFGNGVAPLQGVAPGTYALCLLGYDAASTTAEMPAAGLFDTCTRGFTVTVTNGGTAIAGLTMSTGAGVSGRVTDRTGKPLAGVRVHISQAAVADSDSDDPFDDYDPADAITAADGTYSARSVTPGAQTVCFDASQIGTAIAGYQDQCIGGVPGSVDDGAGVVLSVGENTGADQVLQPGPPRDPDPDPGEDAVPSRTAATAVSPRRATTFVLVDGGRRVVAVHRPAAVVAGIRPTAWTAASAQAWLRTNAARLASLPATARLRSRLDVRQTIARSCVTRVSFPCRVTRSVR